VQAAFKLRPDAGEAHLARAGHLYRGYLEYERALGELEIARQTLPNDPQIFELTGYIRRRQGHEEEGVQNLERALELDPRNVFTLQQISLSYGNMRHYREAAAVLDRALAIAPGDADTQVGRAALDFTWTANPSPLHQVIDSIRANNPAKLLRAAAGWVAVALAERDPVAVEAALGALGDGRFGDDAVRFGRSFGEGLLGRMTGDETKARAAFTVARIEQEKIVQAQPDYGPALCVLGLIDAGLGRKEEALREGRRAMELLPVAKEPINGALIIEHFAVIAAWVGEQKLACEQLEIATRLSGLGLVTYGQLKLSPFWDPLRGYPRFEKIVASLAPKRL
jgi:tetratricopeptide (TPR) repeat protein